MKSFMLFVSLFSAVIGFAQTAIVSDTLTITCNKTTNLLFNYPISAADKGSRDISIQIPKGVENVLQVKAIKPNFSSTSLSVITADGQCHSLIILYATEPPALVYSFGKDSTVSFAAHHSNPSEIQSDLRTLSGEPGFLYHCSRNEGITWILRSIYIHNQVLWFSFLVRNRSNIDFNPENIQFSLEDRKKTKRMAVQERELSPEHEPRVLPIKGNQSQSFSVSFHSFTIPRNKVLIAEMKDFSGRHLVMRIGHRLLLRAKQFHHQ